MSSASDEAPSSYAAALARPDADQWRQAMDEEIAALQSNGTWTLQQLPPDRKAIACRWVYALKRNEKGGIERYKARLVAKGFSQQPGVDYQEVWAPVSQYKTLRALLAIVAARNLELHQLDIKTAFLNGDVDEELYMRQPPGYQDSGNLVCRLHRSLYGLKQASRAWHTKLRDFVATLGFVASDADPCLFVLDASTTPTYMLVYVDDLLIAAPSVAAVERIKSLVLQRFSAHSLGEAKLFLGMSVVRDRPKGLLWLHQSRYARDVVKRFGLEHAKPVNMPLTRDLQLRRGDAGGAVVEEPYAALVGSLMYLMTCSRPDISQAVGALSRHVSDARKVHWDAAVRVLRYVAGTLEYGIQYGGAKGELVGYSDSDYAGDLDTRRSTTAFVWTLHAGAVSWRSVLQPTVALSTAEAEYMAAASAAREALWWRKLCADLGEPAKAPTIYSDSQCALALVRNPVVSQRSKHIDVLHHFVRERAARGEVAFQYCGTERMVADALTKVVGVQKFTWCRSLMGLVDTSLSGSVVD